MIAITVERDEIGPVLELIARRTGNMETPISRTLESGIEDAKAVVAGDGEGQWAPVSPFTLKVDEVFGRSRGGLLEGIAESLSVTEIGPFAGEVASSSPAAAYQQFGTDVTFFVLQANQGGREYGGSGIPPRPFLWWHEERLDEYDGVFMDYLIGEGEGNA